MPAWKQYRRRRASAAPFPDDWQRILRRTFPLYARLDPAARRRLEQRIQIFLREKRFEGCAGLELTAEMRVTIAAQACLLILNRPSDYYPAVRSILVYPEAFTDPSDAAGAARPPREGARLGEAWQQDLVVLSWRHALSGAQHHARGHNVIVHEFAHQLDLEDGAFDGTPVLPPAVPRGTWTQVLARQFERLHAAVLRGEPTVIDPYGATNIVEFFAVASELFFENPEALREDAPELHALLRLVYNFDPLTLQPPSDTAAAACAVVPGEAAPDALKEAERVLGRMLLVWWGAMGALALVVLAAPPEWLIADLPFDLLFMSLLALALLGHRRLGRKKAPPG